MMVRQIMIDLKNGGGIIEPDADMYVDVLGEYLIMKISIGCFCFMLDEIESIKIWIPKTNEEQSKYNIIQILSPL